MVMAFPFFWARYAETDSAAALYLTFLLWPGESDCRTTFHSVTQQWLVCRIADFPTFPCRIHVTHGPHTEAGTRERLKDSERLSSRYLFYKTKNPAAIRTPVKRIENVSNVKGCACGGNYE